jgi:hypothetical protein
MDSAALVSVDVQRGLGILNALDQAGLNVKVALWAVLSEYDDWRLVVASPKFDSLGLTDAFGLLNDSLNSAGLDSARKPSILILPLRDPFIKDLRRVFRKTKNVDGMRIGSQLLGDRFVRDGYVYRIS